MTGSNAKNAIDLYGAVNNLNISNNNFNNGGTAGTIQFAIYNLQESAVTDIIGNEFVNWHDNSTVLRFKNAAATTTINIKYNYFDEKTKYNLNQEVAGLTPVYENNYYAAEQKTATPDYGVITSKDDLAAAYAEYLAKLK